MTDDRNQRVQKLFQAALEVPEEEQDGVLNQRSRTGISIPGLSFRHATKR